MLVNLNETRAQVAVMLKQLLFSDGICVTAMALKKQSLAFSGLPKRELEGDRSEGVARRSTIHLSGRIKVIPLRPRPSIPDSGGVRASGERARAHSAAKLGQPNEVC